MRRKASTDKRQIKGCLNVTSSPVTICSHSWQCPAILRPWRPAPLVPCFAPRAKQRCLLMPTSHSHRSTTPGALANKTTQNSLDKRPTDNNVEWELTPNTVSRATAAATKPKSTPPLPPALKSSLRVMQGFSSSILTSHRFPSLLGDDLCSSWALPDLFCFP